MGGGKDREEERERVSFCFWQSACDFVDVYRRERERKVHTTQMRLLNIRLDTHTHTHPLEYALFACVLMRAFE